jgi:cell wall-associated NlpC family hydrolase
MTVTFDDLIGKPFLDLGRGPDGYDCWGIVMEVSGRLGLRVMDYGDHSSCLDQRSVSTAYLAHRHEYLEVAVPKPGDIVLYKNGTGDLHFGIVIDDHHFLHTSKGNVGCRRNRFDHPAMSGLIKGFYRCVT